MATPAPYPTTRLAPMPAGGPGGRPTRRPYKTSELQFVQQHYPNSTAATLAQQLGRTAGVRFPQ